MDPASFLRSRTVLAVWVAVPLILILCVYQGTNLYCRRVEVHLAQDRAMMEILPDLMTGLNRARETLGKFAIGDSAPAGSENVDLFLSEAPANHGFQLGSVQVSENAARKGDQSPYTSVNLEGRGTLLSMMRFLEILQQPNYLVTVESANVRLLAEGQEEPLYAGQFVLHYMTLSPSTAK